MCWEVKSLHTGVSVLLFVLCESVNISVHLYCCLFEGVELGGHLCSKLLFLSCLVMHFQGAHGTAAGLPHHFELQLSSDCKVSLRSRVSLLTPFDAPQILSALIVLCPVDSSLTFQWSSDTDVPGGVLLLS